MGKVGNMALAFAALAFGSCGSAPKGDGGDEDLTVEQPAEEVAQLNADDLLRVCQAGVAFRGARSPDGIEVTTQGEDLVRASYTRSSDGKAFRYDCRVDGEVIRFRMIDEAGPGTGPGVWSGSGSTTTFRVEDEGIRISESYGPGDATTEFIALPK